MHKQVSRGEPPALIVLESNVPVSSPHHGEGNAEVSHLLPNGVEPILRHPLRLPLRHIRHMSVDSDLYIRLYDLSSKSVTCIRQVLPGYQPQMKLGALSALHLGQLVCSLEGINLRVGEKTWLENIATVSILQEFCSVQHICTVTLLKIESHHLTASSPHGKRI